MKTVQFPINSEFYKGKKTPTKHKVTLSVGTQSQSAHKISPLPCVQCASGLLESSFKIDCTQADFPRLMGARDRAHTSYASKPTTDLKCISLNEWHVETPGREPCYKELN